VQQKLGILEQQTCLFIAMEFLSLRPTNFSSSRNLALHARSLGPPWSTWLWNCMRTDTNMCSVQNFYREHCWWL